MTNNKFKLKVGLFGIGLEAYWEQFQGLKKRLESYLEIVSNRIGEFGEEVVNLGLIDTSQKAMEAGHQFRQADVDIIFLYVTTYALSSTVLPVVQRAKVPVIILNLSPEASINYAQFNALNDRTAMTGEWLSYCSACPVPEIANVFKRVGIQFHQVTGMLHNDKECWNEIKEWIEASQVANIMSHNRLGAMGHYYSGMLDIYTDLILQTATFGGHIEIIEVDELSALRRSIKSKAIKDRVNHFYEAFDVQPNCSFIELEKAARTSLALDKLVELYALGSMAYYYKGSGNADNEDTMSSIILGTSLLTARNIPVAGEYEIKNAQAMKIMDSFGVGGSFTEYYAMDFKDDVVLMGHDGPGHLKIAEGKIKVRPLTVYHGKVGKGLSVEMAVKHGPVTCLTVVEGANGNLFFLIAEGQSVEGPILEIGNTNSRYKFSIGARKFVNDFNCGTIDATITFTSPLLIKDLDILSRPVSYITYSVQSNDGRTHDVQIFLGASTNIAVNTSAEEVVTKKYSALQLNILKAGTKAQPILQKKGDDIRIDWGYMYVAVLSAAKATQYISSASQAAATFISGKTVSNPVGDTDLVLNTTVSLGKVGDHPKEQYFLLGYDDRYSIQYFHTNLRPWWNRNGNQTIEKQLAKAATGYNVIMQQCEAWNKNLYTDLVNAGGKTYADLCIVAYRQCIAAHKLLQSPQGEILFLIKRKF